MQAEEEREEEGDREGEGEGERERCSYHLPVVESPGSSASNSCWAVRIAIPLDSEREQHLLSDSDQLPRKYPGFERRHRSELDRSIHNHPRLRYHPSQTQTTSVNLSICL